MKKINTIKKLPLRLFIWIYFVISVYPFLYLIFYSLKDNNEIFFTNSFGFPKVLRFENYIKGIKAFNMTLYFRNSVIVTAISIVFVVLFSLAFAYAVARINWKFAKAAYAYILFGIFIPLPVMMIPLAILGRELKISGTYMSVILPYIAFNLAFSSLIFYGFFRTIPAEMEESAYIDGAGLFRTFIQIMVPLVKPAIATVTTFAFINIWNEYAMALVLLNNIRLRTLPVGLATSFIGAFQTEWGPMGAAMVIASLPMIIIYLFLSEQVERAMTIGSAVKG